MCRDRPVGAVGAPRRPRCSIGSEPGLADGTRASATSAACGLFIGVELVRDRATQGAGPERPRAVRPGAAFERGVVVAVAGRYEQVVKISPPLTIDEGQAIEAVDVVIDAIRRSR